MYTTVGKNQFHTQQAYKMGKEAFVKAHKTSVRDVVKVWEQIEKAAKKEVVSTKKPKEK